MRKSETRSRSKIEMNIPENLKCHVPSLMATRWFANLPSRVREGILTASTMRHLPAGKSLFSQGEKGKGLYCVISGGVTIRSIAPNGKEAMFVKFERAYWFGEMELIDDKPHATSCVAHVATTVLMVTRAAIEAMAKEDPEMWCYLSVLLAEKSRVIIKKYEELITLPARARAARRLLDIADGHGAYLAPPQRTVKFSQEQLGATLGLTRQSISEILKNFESRGMIKQSYGAIDLLDWEGLRQEGNAY